jgi:hypothetical protein
VLRLVTWVACSARFSQDGGDLLLGFILDFIEITGGVPFVAWYCWPWAWTRCVVRRDDCAEPADVLPHPAIWLRCFTRALPRPLCPSTSTIYKWVCTAVYPDPDPCCW